MSASVLRCPVRTFHSIQCSDITIVTLLRLDTLRQYEPLLDRYSRDWIAGEIACLGDEDRLKVRALYFASYICGVIALMR